VFRNHKRQGEKDGRHRNVYVVGLLKKAWKREKQVQARGKDASQSLFFAVLYHEMERFPLFQQPR